MFKVGDTVRLKNGSKNFIGRYGRIIEEKFINNKKAFLINFNNIPIVLWFYEHDLELVDNYEYNQILG